MYFLNFYNMKKNRFLNYSLFVSFVFFANQIFSEESFIPKPPTVNASNYILIDSISGRILAESGADEKIEPASITKIMTGYIAADQIQQGFVNLDDEVYISENCWGATTGKHLNFIDRDKSKRLPRWEFEELFQQYHGKVEEVA